MLKYLELASLQQRRKFNKLVFLFKIAGSMVPAINSDEYLIPQRQKRRIKGKQFSASMLKYTCSRENVTSDSMCFIVDNYRPYQFRHSFFIDSVIKWNYLPDSILHTETVACFKSALHKRDSIRALSPIVLIPVLVLLRRRYRQIHTRAISVVGLCHMRSSRCIGPYYTIRRLLSDILGLVCKRLLFQYYTGVSDLTHNKLSSFYLVTQHPFSALPWSNSGDFHLNYFVGL